MSIAALALDRYADSTSSVAVKENNIGVDETSKSFGAHLNEATEKKCPYSFLAKDGIINYKGVVFECDYQQNAITLGNMYEKEKEPELQENSLIEQINSYKTELYRKLLNNETEVKIRIVSQEFSDKEWDKLMERVDQEQERIQEALDEKEEKQAEEFMQAKMAKA